MSPVAISGHGQGHGLQPSAAFRAHRREDKGSAHSEGIAAVGKPGQLPVGTGPSLLSGAVQSLRQSASNRVSGAPAQLGGSLNVTA